MASVHARAPLASTNECKSSFLSVVKNLVDFDSGEAQENQLRREECEPIIHLLTSGVFRIVVMGEIKKGKSSFINALLDHPDLLPTNKDVATSTVFKILYGNQLRVTVFFLKDEHKNDAPLDIPLSEIGNYGTETGNPDNVRGVDFIAIQVPSPLLRDGLVLVDTPGVGGLFKRHRHITFQYAPSADAVLFVVDSVESMISQDEISFLKELSKHTNRIVFIQTKSDLAGDAQVIAWKDRNLSILSQTLGVPAESLSYFVVSSQLKVFADETKSVDVLNDSGFAEFLRFFQSTLIGGRDKLQMLRWLPVVRQVTARQKESLATRWHIANQAQAQNRPQLEKLAQELRQAEEAFMAWQSDRWPGIQREYRNSVSQLDRASANAMEDATLPENTVAPISADLRKSARSPDDILQMDEQIRSSHAAQLSNDVSTILANYKQGFETIFQQTEVATWTSLPPAQVLSVSIQSNESSDVDISKFRTMRETYMGTMFLSSLGRRLGAASGAGLGILVGLNVLTLGTATFVAGLGGLALVANEIWTYVSGYKQSREKQAGEALRALEQALSRTCQAANRVGRRELNNLSAELKMTAEDVFFGFQKQVRSDYEQRRTAIEKARSQTIDESKVIVDDLAGKIKKIDGMHRTIDEITRSLAQA